MSESEINLKFRTLIFIGGILLSISICFIDFAILGPDITFTMVYLIPIVFMSWYVGFKQAIVLSLLCTAEWAFIHLFKVSSVHNYLEFAFNVVTKLLMYCFIAYLLSRLKQSLKSEKQNARRDYLTGAFNRQGFFEKLEIELYNMKRYDRKLVLAYLDIDNFKYIDDTFGHHAGDELLVNIVKVMLHSIRKSDVLARMGGDEFILMFPDMDLTQAKIAIEKIRIEIQKSISETTRLNYPDCSVSLGVGVFQNWSGSIDEIIRVVDQLMYKVKKSTKNGVEYMEYE